MPVSKSKNIMDKSTIIRLFLQTFVQFFDDLHRAIIERESGWSIFRSGVRAAFTLASAIYCITLLSSNPEFYAYINALATSIPVLNYMPTTATRYYLAGYTGGYFGSWLSTLGINQLIQKIKGHPYFFITSDQEERLAQLYSKLGYPIDDSRIYIRNLCRQLEADLQTTSNEEYMAPLERIFKEFKKGEYIGYLNFKDMHQFNIERNQQTIDYINKKIQKTKLQLQAIKNKEQDHKPLERDPEKPEIVLEVSKKKSRKKKERTEMLDLERGVMLSDFPITTPYFEALKNKEVKKAIQSHIREALTQEELQAKLQHLEKAKEDCQRNQRLLVH